MKEKISWTQSSSNVVMPPPIIPPYHEHEMFGHSVNNKCVFLQIAIGRAKKEGKPREITREGYPNAIDVANQQKLHVRREDLNVEGRQEM